MEGKCFFMERLPMTTTMNQLSTIYSSSIEDLMNKIGEELFPWKAEDEEMVRRASFFVRNGAVKLYSYDIRRQIVGATVADVVSAHVTMNFVDEELTCSCHSEGTCRHMLAFLFSLYIQHHSLTTWVNEWKSKENEQLTLFKEDRSPKTWEVVLKQTFAPIHNLSGETGYHAFIQKMSNFSHKAESYTPFEREWRPMFEVYVRFYKIRSAWHIVSHHLEDHDGGPWEYEHWYFNNWLENETGKLSDALAHLASKPRLFATDAFFAALRNEVRDFVQRGEGLFNHRVSIYLAFWANLFTEKKWREEEMALLKDSNSESKSFMLSFFYVLLKRHEDLQAMVSDAASGDIEKWLTLAGVANDSHDPKSIRIIMEAIFPYVGEFLHSHSSPADAGFYVQKMEELYARSGLSSEQREQLFYAYGRHGIDEYAEFLLEQRRYSDWIALHHRFNTPYEALDYSGLKTVAAEAPGVILPLLHVHAMKCVAEKSRPSYKQAVRIWKRMKTAARKSGKTDYYNRYISKVGEKYKRLRALREEMEKGNLTL